MFTDKNLICRKFFFLIFILSVVYPVSAQQNSSKITVVIAGYGIIGQDFNSNEEARFNRALERTLGKPEFYHFMELAAIESVDLNRIRREIGQNNSTPDQRFHYTVYGDITINSGIYSIRTVLINNKNGRIRPWFDDDLFNISKAISTVEDHGKKIAEFLKIIQLDVTKGSIRSSMADEDYEVALERLQAYRFKAGDSIELQNLEREIRRRLLDQSQTSDPPSLPNNPTREILSREDSLIEQELATNFSRDGERFYEQNNSPYLEREIRRGLSGQAQTSDPPSLPNNPTREILSREDSLIEQELATNFPRDGERFYEQNNSPLNSLSENEIGENLSIINGTKSKIVMVFVEFLTAIRAIVIGLIITVISVITKIFINKGSKKYIRCFFILLGILAIVLFVIVFVTQ